MLDWWQRIVGRQPLPDGPRRRYELQRRLGASVADALATVASSYGLTTSIPVTRSDGAPAMVRLTWTIEQMDRLLFAQYLYRQGRLTED